MTIFHWNYHRLKIEFWRFWTITSTMKNWLAILTNFQKSLNFDVEIPSIKMTENLINFKIRFLILTIFHWNSRNLNFDHFNEFQKSLDFDHFNKFSKIFEFWRFWLTVYRVELCVVFHLQWRLFPLLKLKEIFVNEFVFYVWRPHRWNCNCRIHCFSPF